MYSQYQIVSDTDTQCMKDLLSNFLSIGWRLHGDLVVVFNPAENTMQYTQAMVRV